MTGAITGEALRHPASSSRRAFIAFYAASRLPDHDINRNDRQSPMSELPIFETPRLTLRGVTLEDAPFIQKYFNDYAIIGELAARVPWPYPEGGATDFLANTVLPRQGNDHWVWGIFPRESPAELIGIIDLWRREAPENRGFWLARKYWGRGIMTEAVAPVTAHAFNALGFERLIFGNAVGNLRSRRIKEKSGARWLRAEPAKFVNPEYTEREIWELTKEDWRDSSISTTTTMGLRRIEAPGQES